MVRATASAIRVAGLPAMDERLKSILAGQVGILLRGGWPLDEVTQAAKDLALAWDEKRGHNRLCHLASRVRVLDADRERRAHIARLAANRADLSAIAAGTPSIAGSSHPNFHDFIADQNDRSSCGICRGPLGVHVRAGVNTSGDGVR